MILAVCTIPRATSEWRLRLSRQHGAMNRECTRGIIDKAGKGESDSQQSGLIATM